MWLPLQGTDTGSLTVHCTEHGYDRCVAGEVNVLVTITATEGSGYKTAEQHQPCHDGHVGQLVVNVLEADGLQPKSLGKRQPFVVLELVNQRVQTRPREGIHGLKWDRAFDLYALGIFNLKL